MSNVSKTESLFLKIKTRLSLKNSRPWKSCTVTKLNSTIDFSSLKVLSCTDYLTHGGKQAFHAMPWHHSEKSKMVTAMSCRLSCLRLRRVFNGGQRVLKTSECGVLLVCLCFHREAAKESRLRKKQYVQHLETSLTMMENQNKKLAKELEYLKKLYTLKPHSY